MSTRANPRIGAALLQAVVLAVVVASRAAAVPEIVAQPIAGGAVFAKPLFVTHAPADYQRLFIVEQGGKIKIVHNGAVLPTPFLDVSGLLSTSWLEHGLLGLTFHPDFPSNGYFYITYCEPPTATSPTVLARYRVSADPSVADAASASVVLRITHNAKEHRAGWIGFGPDGYLYVASGDGGPETDPQDKASKLSVLQGKLLRLDVNGPDGVPGTADDDEFPADPNKNYRIPADNPFVGFAGALPEIWAYGLRNPWRCSFDRVTGDLWISDVGQQTREEIDFQPAASAGGEFYGWRCMEGTVPFQPCSAAGTPSVAPIYEYPTAPARSVIGGYVYRGCEMPELQGTYFLGDWISTSIRAFHYSPVTGVTDFWQSPAGFATSAASFGEDAYGELYICSWSANGPVLKITPLAPSMKDCNRNGVSDSCDIASGQSADVNGDGVPDECNATCSADLMPDDGGDGVVNGLDLASLLGAWSGFASYPRCPPPKPQDLNGDCKVNGVDLALLLGAWGRCP